MKIVGIDLGTTNSCVAVMKDGKPVVIKNAEGEITTPSVVAFSNRREKLVGESAKRQAVSNVENTVFSIKRDIGTDNSHIMDGMKYSPQQIYAMILQKLKADVESYLQEKVSETVITVPAYFDILQRQEIRDAAELVGLDVKRVISEPSAAALAYAFNFGCNEEKIMICDLGGGNFNVAIYTIADDVVDAMAVNGDIHLGGDDFDNRIVQWMLDELREEGVNLSSDKIAMQRLKEAAEKAKKELSYVMTANIHLPFIVVTAEGPVDFDRNLTREKFEELISDLVEKTTIPVQNVMKDADLTNVDLGQVFLVGGSTSIPAVQEKIRQLTGKEPRKILNPDESVAIGASVQGGKLAGDAGAKDFLLVDVTPLTLSIVTQGGNATRIIERNTTIPTKKSQVFCTTLDNQTAMDIVVVQGEKKLAQDNKFLGQFRLYEIPPAKKGQSQIEITFDIDANGSLNVSAKSLNAKKGVTEAFPIVQQNLKESHTPKIINALLPACIDKGKTSNFATGILSVDW